ncbi:S8 family peptidase [Scytonema sp. PCC 10023]|uniref:S8 family peptidase n=1 Tax=Scytonema sp. PCC 10023 TaxID=1680591 RepID=UPI0039C6E16E
MARFVMANRIAGKFKNAEKVASRQSLDFTFETEFSHRVNLISDINAKQPDTRRIVVFDAEPNEMAVIANNLPPEVILEPEILHYPTETRFHSAWIPFVTTEENAADAGNGQTLTVHVKGNGQGVEGAELILLLRNAFGATDSIEVKQKTPASGSVTFSYNFSWIPTALFIYPSGKFWSYVVRGPKNQIEIDLPALPEGPLGWWHQVLGIEQYSQERGHGTRIGVIDTGVGPHSHLSHVKCVGAFIGGNIDPLGNEDVGSHGTHVCGIIGARPPQSSKTFAGIAPGAELFCGRVFPANGKANQADIANAIDCLSRDNQVDLINLSLGADKRSEIERDAIIDALRRGTLCICSAGNSAARVIYPAAFDETIAVSALGLEGWGPDGTLASIRYPTEKKKYGKHNLYLSDFSCFGPEITCCAPGVGIISTVPERYGLLTPNAAMDGTSMASPIICAALAVILSATPDYLSLPRDSSRSSKARDLLRSNCRDLGLNLHYQGHGILEIPR